MQTEPLPPAPPTGDSGGVFPPPHPGSTGLLRSFPTGDPRTPYLPLTPELALQILRRPLLALVSAGIGLTSAAPALASEQPGRWNPKADMERGRIAYLPPLPQAPRVFAITPERRALLNTIRYAEGTWANGEDRGYWIMFGGGMMPSLDRHPDRVVRSARYASAAAGAYQFMPPTWAMVTRSLGLRTHGPQAFGPHVQDQAAIYLIQRRGALHLADRGVFSPEDSP